MNEVNPRRARLLLGWVTVFGQVWRLAVQPTSFVRLANALLKDEESARDNHVLTCNFTKYSPIKKIVVTDRLSNKPFLVVLLKHPTAP